MLALPLQEGLSILIILSVEIWFRIFSVKYVWQIMPIHAISRYRITCRVDRKY